MMLFETRSLCAGYGSENVLKNISLEIREGEFISIIGPNGSGKSTLLNVLSGLIRPSSGTCNYMGTQVSSIPPSQRARKFSVVHQGIDEVPPFTVHDFVRLGLFAHENMFGSLPDRRESDPARWIGELGLSSIEHRPLNRISGGERQLAFIARALVQNSGCLLLDEPVSNLDPGQSVKIMDTLYRLNRGGAAIIAVLHNINLASDYSKRIAALKDGIVLFDGDPDSVLKYENVEKLYSSIFTVIKNPVSGRPFVYSVPGYLE
jgi:iron complex transport system ATP-binding protein